MKKVKKIIIISLVIVALLVGSAFTIKMLRNKNREKKTIDVYPVRDIGESGEWYANENSVSGNVAVSNEQKIYLSSTQKVNEVLVSEGDEVHAGDVLMVYDTTAQGLQVETKKAEVEVARVAVVVAKRELTELQNTTPVEKTEELPPEDNTEEPPADEPVTPPEEEPVAPPEEPVTPPSDVPTQTPTDAQNDNPSNESDNQADAPESAPVDITTDFEDGEGDPFEVTYTAEELAKAIADKQNEIKELETQYQLKQIELEIMEYQSANGEVLCNFDGVVKTVMDQEEAILNNEPFIVVTGTDGYTVQSVMGELSLATVGIGDTVSMYCYETGFAYDGIITEISDIPSEEQYYYNGGAEQSYYPITIAITDTFGTTLYRGMYMDVTINSNTSDSSNSYYLPLAFVKKENGNYYVMKDVDGRLQKNYVKTGKIMWGSEIEIKGGISMKDYIALPYSKNAIENVKTVQKTASDLYNY